MATAKISDEYILSGLNKMDPDVIKLVFYNESEYRARMKEAIRKMWDIKDEHISVVIMSFCHYVTSDYFKRINQWRTLSNKIGIPLTQLLQDALLAFLVKRIEFKDEAQCLYAVLTGTDDDTPMTRTRLNAKNALNQFLWDDGSCLDAIVGETTQALNELYGQNLSSNYFKEQLHQALCVHPEKILETYDFSEPLDTWRETTLRRRTSEICIVYLIDQLLAHDEIITERLFHPGSHNWDVITNSIRSAWKITDEDITAVVKTFIYTLIIRFNGKELRAIRKDIVKEVPYCALPFKHDGKQPKKWLFYNDAASFSDLLMECASRYGKEREKFKEERKLLGKLMLSPDDKDRTDYLWAPDGEKYQEKISETTEALAKIGIKKDNETLKSQLLHFLCDDPVGLLVRYDFKEYLKDWCLELAESFIEDRPRLDILLSGREAVKLFKAEYEELIKYVARTYRVNGKSVVLSEQDFIQDLFVLLYENDRKSLKNFKFESRLHNYIVKIATNRLKQDKKIAEEEEEVLNDIINGDSKVEKKKDPEVDLRDKAGVYELLIKLLRKPGMKEYFGFGKRNDEIFSTQLEIIERVHVNLVDFTSKEQEEKRKELIEQFGSFSKNPKSFLSGNEKRAKEILEKVKNDIQRLITSKEKLTPVEKDILKELEIDEPIFNDYSYDA